MTHEELLQARLKASRYQQLCTLLEYLGGAVILGLIVFAANR